MKNNLFDKAKSIKNSIKSSMDTAVEEKDGKVGECEPGVTLSEFDKFKVDLDQIDNQKVGKLAKLKSIIGKRPSQDEQRIELLRVFPIPDSRDEISEFMALCRLRQQRLRIELQAKLSDKERDNKNLLMSMWDSKYEESFQKGLHMYPEDDEFRSIQNERNKRIAQDKSKTKRSIYAIVGIVAACMAALAVFGMNRPVNDSSNAKESSNVVQTTASVSDGIPEEEPEIGVRTIPVQNDMESAYESSEIDSSNENIDKKTVKSEDVSKQIEMDADGPVTEKNQINGFNENNGLSIVGKYGFYIPLYWKSSIRNNQRYEAYAENGDKVAKLRIFSTLDEEDPVTIDILKDETDNGKMAESFGSWFQTVNSVTSEEFSNQVVSGYLYSIDFTDNELHGTAKCLVFPSESDNSWMYVTLAQTDNTEYYYDEDFLRTLNSIDDINKDGDYSYDLEKAMEDLVAYREIRKLEMAEKEATKAAANESESEEYMPVVENETEGYAKVYSNTVYIPARGQKYHSRPNCGNMKNAYAISESDAISRGYEQCRKCY